VHYRWYLLAKVWRTPLAGELLQRAMNRAFFDLNIYRGKGRRVPTPFVDRMWRDFDAGTRHAILALYRATDVERIVSVPVETFQRLHRPALVVWGRQDPYIPIRFAHAHEHIYPGLRSVFLEKSGHWPFIDDPDGVAEPVVAFLRHELAGGG
jgi:pimeloyl-ACP methyl ester carboxylesterase